MLSIFLLISLNNGSKAGKRPYLFKSINCRDLTLYLTMLMTDMSFIGVNPGGWGSRPQILGWPVMGVLGGIRGVVKGPRKIP